MEIFEQHLKEVYSEYDLIYDRRGSQICSVEVLTEDGHLDSISERNVVSTLIHSEYYQHLSQAQECSQQLTSEVNLDNIQRVWRILKFQKLTQLSLTGFHQPDLSLDQAETILRYVNNSHLLEQLNLTEFRLDVWGILFETKIWGQVPFLGENGLLMVTCSSHLDLTWLQGMIYSELLSAATGSNLTQLHLYNPLTGQLWRRERPF